VVICLERGADLHVAQLMPLPLTVSCSSKIHIGFTFLVPAYPGSPGQRAVKRVCGCVTNIYCYHFFELYPSLYIERDLDAVCCVLCSRVALNFTSEITLCELI